MSFAGVPHCVQNEHAGRVIYQGILFFESYLKTKDNIISTASVFGRIGVGLLTKDRNSTFSNPTSNPTSGVVDDGAE